MGRPDGKPNKKDSLEPVAKRLGELLKMDVTFLPDCVGAAGRCANRLGIRGLFSCVQTIRKVPCTHYNLVYVIQCQNCVVQFIWVPYQKVSYTFHNIVSKVSSPLGIV